MRLPSLVYGLLASSLSSPPPSQHAFTETQALTDTQRIPTRDESTVLGRRLLAKSRTGVLSTVFPKNISSAYVPHSVASTPIGLPDYIASCEEPTGNPTLLALTISTSTRNAVAGSNASLTLSWWDEYRLLTGQEPWSAANLPRLNMVGYLEEIPKDEVEVKKIAKCFTDVHNDAKWWLPGDDSSPHRGLWMRMVVEEIYWIGGFGDRAFIGWFDPKVWKGVTKKQWQDVRLPGEAV